MKRNIINTLKIKAHFFILISLLSSNLITKAANDTEISNEQQHRISTFIENFLNKDIEPGKPFEGWLEDLKNLLQGAPNFSQYCTAIDNIKKSRNIYEAGRNFEKFQNLIPARLKQDLAKKYSKAIILKNLTERLKRRTK